MTIVVHQLPTELLVSIFDFLNQNTIIRRVALVNKTLYHLVLHSEDVWRNRVVVVNNSAYATCVDGGWRQALLMVKNCSPRHVNFTYLPLIDLINVMTEAREHLTSLQLSWCENSFAVNDYVMCRLWDLQWPLLEKLAIGYYYSGARSSVEQVFRHVLPNAPKLKHLNGFELPILNYGSQLNWSQLDSMTLVNDHDNSEDNNTMLTNVAEKLSNLSHLELKAEGFEFSALNKLFEHATNLKRLQAHDLFTFNVNHQFEHLTELRLSRSERVVGNIIRACRNIDSLQLDMHASYEVKEVAQQLTNLRHLWIEKYSKSLIEIMNHCELQTLRIGNMDIRENGLIDKLILHGQSIRSLVMDHVKLNSSADMDLIMTRLTNLKELTVNVCHTANGSGPIEPIKHQGVKTFTYCKSRTAVDIRTFATPDLKHLIYTKAKRESKYGIRPDDFQYLTRNSPNLKSVTMSLFDVSYITNPNKRYRFDIFQDLHTCHLTFGEFGSLAHICCVLICCQNASSFSVDSITCKAEYVDQLRQALKEEKKKDNEKYKTCRSQNKIKSKSPMPQSQQQQQQQFQIQSPQTPQIQLPLQQVSKSLLQQINKLALKEEKKMEKVSQQQQLLQQQQQQLQQAQIQQQLQQINKSQPQQSNKKEEKKKDKGSSQRFGKVKKSHNKKQTCNLIQLAKIVWAAMEQVLTSNTFYSNGRDVTADLKKKYKDLLINKFNPKVNSRNASLLHEFLHVLQQRVLMNDIPKKMLIYGQH